MKRTLNLAILMLGAMGLRCWANAVTDPLAGYCAPAGVGCIDNGTHSPTDLNPPVSFGFTDSGGPATGPSLLVTILQPNNEAPFAPVTITGTFSGTATPMGTWTMGTLASFLGITASPDNPIGAFLPDPGDPGASAFFVYELNISPMGGVTLQSPSHPNEDPLLNIPGGVAQGSYIVGFLNTGTSAAPNWVATENSGSILVTSAVPEPSSITLVGLGALGMVALLKRKRYVAS